MEQKKIIKRIAGLVLVLIVFLGASLVNRQTAMIIFRILQPDLIPQEPSELLAILMGIIFVLSAWALGVLIIAFIVLAAWLFS